MNRLQHEIKTKATEELVTRRRYDNSIEEVERLREVVDGFIGIFKVTYGSPALMFHVLF